MRFKTMFNGYSLAFSRFWREAGGHHVPGPRHHRERPAVRAGHGARGRPGEIARFETADGLYDCCWSEENENILVSASGDGSVKVYDISAPPR